MATLKLVQNGAKKVANPRRRRRRNPSTAKSTVSRSVANPRKRRRRRRNGVAATSALSRVANPRRRRTTRRRRNGVSIRRVSNGIFGDTKSTAKSVLSLLGGLAVTKVEGSLLSPMASNLLASVGLGAWGKPLVEAGMATTFNRWAANAVAGKDAGKFAMIGGLAMAAMSVIEILIPQTSTYNPFASANSAPIVLNQPNVISAGQAQQLAAAVNAQKAAMSGALVPRAIRRPRY